MLDQGLFSLANFLVSILLARWLSPEDYGAFAVALSVYYLLLNFHTAVLTEPMMVFGAGKYREQFRKYLGMLLYGHWGISALISLILGVAALIFARYGSTALAEALAGLAIASPFLLLLWLVRRACYVPMRPGWAVISSGVNLLLTIAGVFLFWKVRLLSEFSGLMLLGLAAIVASLFALVPLRPQVSGFTGNPTVRMLVGDHRGYGSWNLLAVIAYWTSGQVLMLLIPIFLGLAAGAAVAAVWNLYRPVSLFIQSMGSVILPTFSRWVNQGVPALELKKQVTRLALLFGGAVAFYGLMLTIASKPILHLLYAGKYDEHWGLVGLSGIPWAMVAMLVIFGSFLKSLSKVRQVSLVWGAASVLTVITAIPSISIAGIGGAIIAFALSYMVACYLSYRAIGPKKVSGFSITSQDK